MVHIKSVQVAVCHSFEIRLLLNRITYSLGAYVERRPTNGEITVDTPVARCRRVDSATA